MSNLKPKVRRNETDWAGGPLKGETRGPGDCSGNPRPLTFFSFFSSLIFFFSSFLLFFFSYFEDVLLSLFFCEARIFFSLSSRFPISSFDLRTIAYRKLWYCSTWSILEWFSGIHVATNGKMRFARQKYIVCKLQCWHVQNQGICRPKNALNRFGEYW